MVNFQIKILIQVSNISVATKGLWPVNYTATLTAALSYRAFILKLKKIIFKISKILFFN